MFLLLPFARAISSDNDNDHSAFNVYVSWAVHRLIFQGDECNGNLKKIQHRIDAELFMIRFYIETRDARKCVLITHISRPRDVRLSNENRFYKYVTRTESKM